MALLVRCIALLLLLALPISKVPSAGASLVNKGCKARCGGCGGVVIPYPFGMVKSSCYLNEWFEVSCKNNSRPFLKKADLEVLEIDLAQSTILVKHPVIMSKGCRGGSRLGVPDLTGSTFYISPANTFVGVGCDYRFEIANTKSFITGCITSCDRELKEALSSCQNTLPQIQIKVFNVTFEQTVPGAASCGYAFIAEDLWLGNSPSFSLQHLDYHAPATLEWAISNDGVVRMQPGEDAVSCDPQTFDKQSHVRCQCNHGFEGNPYLPNGCRDINECKKRDQNSCPDTCVNIRGGYTCKQAPTKFIVIGIGSSFGLLICIVSVWWLCEVVKKRKETQHKKKLFRQNGGLLLEQQLSSNEGHVETTKVFTSEELEVATDHFNPNRILGHGGQGTVYKGMLPDGRIVAVKKSKIQNETKLVQQFINEVVLLSQINHRNVVKLLGCCLETETPLLVYEFVPNGTLSTYIHEQDEMRVSWNTRLQIANDVAGALSYLHSAASIPIYHRDIKSTNILLDYKYRAKVSDFGTSRSIAIDQTHLSTLVQGTFGYFDPEYFLSSQFTDKSDVYSFGVVLVELLTGQKPICSTRPEEHRSLVAYFITSMEENHLFDILDVSFAQENKDEIVAVANLARRCLNSQGRNRPTMKEVSMELERIIEMTQMGQQNHEETECVTGQEEGNSLHPWNEVGRFTDNGMDTDSPSDGQPMLPSTRKM